MLSQDLCLGIDFGTTNSCLSVWHNNNAIIITDYDGSKTIPTVIEINNNKKVIGKEAYIRQNLFSNTSTPTFLVYEIKKLLGKKFSEINNVDSLAYTITKTDDENDNIVSNKDNKKSNSNKSNIDSDSDSEDSEDSESFKINKTKKKAVKASTKRKLDYTKKSSSIDKNSKEMARTWFVEVFTEQNQVNLYCPACQEKRKIV
jgi:hypothetical protein